MTADPAIFDVENGIAWVRFNRPEKRNCMNPALNRRMMEVLSDLEFRDDVGVLVLSGEGPAWSAGMDLKEYFRETEAKGLGAIRQAQAESYGWWRKLRWYQKPTIAMVNGWCFGGGYGPLFACDLAFAADDQRPKHGHLAEKGIDRVGGHQRSLDIDDIFRPVDLPISRQANGGARHACVLHMDAVLRESEGKIEALEENAFAAHRVADAGQRTERENIREHRRFDDAELVDTQVAGQRRAGLGIVIAAIHAQLATAHASREVERTEHGAGIG